MMFRIAAAPFDMSFSELLSGSGGNGLCGTGVDLEDSEVLFSGSRTSGTLTFRRLCCHFVT